MTETLITTSSVCADLGLTESALRHALRRPNAPRPALHPSARVFLWTRTDLERLKEFLALQRRERTAAQAAPVERNPVIRALQSRARPEVPPC